MFIFDYLENRKITNTINKIKKDYALLAKKDIFLEQEWFREENTILGKLEERCKEVKNETS